MKIKYLECECGFRIYLKEEIPEDMVCDWVRYGVKDEKEVYKQTVICPECESESFTIVLE